MIDKQPDFLPFFLQEPIYLVDEPNHAEVYSALGDNHKRVLVLVDQAEAEHLADANKALLTKILQAVDFTLDDVSIVNVGRAKTPNVVEGELDYQTCISFGMPPEDWQFCNFFKKYEVVRDDTGRAYLWADPLEEIAVDVDKKKSLWLSLKSLFLTE